MNPAPGHAVQWARAYTIRPLPLHLRATPVGAVWVSWTCPRCSRDHGLPYASEHAARDAQFLCPGCGANIRLGIPNDA